MKSYPQTTVQLQSLSQQWCKKIWDLAHKYLQLTKMIDLLWNTQQPCKHDILVVGSTYVEWELEQTCLHCPWLRPNELAKPPSFLCLTKYWLSAACVCKLYTCSHVVLFKHSQYILCTWLEYVVGRHWICNAHDLLSEQCSVVQGKKWEVYHTSSDPCGKFSVGIISDMDIGSNPTLFTGVGPTLILSHH